MTAPRVLQVVLQLDPGGTERLVIELVTRLHQEMPMAVCCLDQVGSWAPQIEALGISVFALRRQPGFRPSLAWRLAQVAADFGADVLHCHHYSPFVYGRLAALRLPGCRVIFTEHGRLSDGQASPKRRLANRLLMLGVADVIAVSHHLRACMLDEGAPRTTRVVWNGIDVRPMPTPVERRRARSALDLPDDAWVVISIARLDPVKDLATLICAVASARRHDPTIELVLIGDGPERARLEASATAERISDHVRFVGHREDARWLLAAGDAYVNTSTSEGISLTILEAMAAGLPVIATAVGGTCEVLVDGETGFLVAVRDPSAVSDVLLQLTRHPSRGRRVGASARSRIEQWFNIDDMTAQYAASYRGC